MKYDPAVAEIIEGAIKVHRALGPGLLESAYERCLDYELAKRGLRIERQVPVRLTYEGLRLDCGYRLDLVVDGDVIVEVKCVDALAPIHTAQVLTYLRLTHARHALLMNFNCPTLREGLRSFLGRGKQVPGESQ
jgi:GxxExxY protein